MPNRNTDSGLALSRTCKQLREECGTRLYSNCIIYTTVFQGSKEETKIKFIRKEETKINYIRIMRKIVSIIGLDNVLLCRGMELRIATKRDYSSITSNEQAIAPAITQLYPWSSRTRIPLRIRLGPQLPLLELLDLTHSCDTVVEEVEQLPRTDYHQQEDFAVALWLPRVCEDVRAAEARKWATAKKATALIEWMVGSDKGCMVESKAENKALIGRQVGGDEAVVGKVSGSMAPRISEKGTSNGGKVAEPSRLALWFAMCKPSLEPPVLSSSAAGELNGADR
ncbi:hypothetical protein LTR22_002885 [Elasticomyces elasticus]|nr:hypothetical protein LTR22_002885 [Elasticomyces elasticus]KAK4926818.1 hypothetical protein LTR49_006234 [Elasticomyces elasticus]KAK5763653.1 hypothetical protein LTS12_006210 [Elasticomyces elasticus]